MATIIGAIASSHTPTIGFALDAAKQQDPVWAPIFSAYAPVAQWLAQARINARALPGEARLNRTAAGLWDGTVVLTLPSR